MTLTCGVCRALMKQWTDRRDRNSRDAQVVESHNLQILRSPVPTAETVASSATRPTRTLSNNSHGVVFAPSLDELQRTAHPRAPSRQSPSPVRPAIRSPQADPSTPTARPRHIQIANLYPEVAANSPLYTVPEASVPTPSARSGSNPPPMNPAYAASRARHEQQALEQGDTSTDFLLQNDDDKSTVVTESEVNPSSTAPQRFSLNEELARRLSVLQKPPGPRIARLPGQDADWEAIGMTPLPGSSPISTRNVARVPAAEPVLTPSFAADRSAPRNEREGTRYRNNEQALYWAQPDRFAPVRPDRRASLEWEARQQRLQRSLAEERQESPQKQQREGDSRAKSFSDWLPDMPTPIREEDSREGEKVEEEDQPVLLQPAVYTPTTGKGKGVARAQGDREGPIQVPQGITRVTLSQIPPESPVLPPMPTYAPARSPAVYVRTRSRTRSKGQKSIENIREDGLEKS